MKNIFIRHFSQDKSYEKDIFVQKASFEISKFMNVHWVEIISNL